MIKSDIDLNGILPEGNNGIAAKYKGDIGIASDPAVLMADDFEDYTSPDDLKKRWNQILHIGNMSITSDPANVFKGNKALQFEIPLQKEEISVVIGNYIKRKKMSFFCVTMQNSVGVLML
jgi:hypothetical protein